MSRTGPAGRGEGRRAEEVTWKLPTRQLTGRRLALTVAAWIVASALVGALTIGVARELAPGWAANGKDVATVVAFEVYALLIATLYAIPGRRGGAATVLRLRPVPAGAFAIAFLTVMLAVVVVDLAYVLAGAGGAVRDTYLRLGTDGGRLGAIGPVATLLSLGRACFLAPLGEELLFRGAVYGWTRSWLSPWPAVVLNAVIWGTLSAAVGGTLVLLPQATVYGLALARIRERTDSTLPGLAMHVLANTAVMSVTYLTGSWR